MIFYFLLPKVFLLSPRLGLTSALRSAPVWLFLPVLIFFWFCRSLACLLRSRALDGAWFPLLQLLQAQGAGYFRFGLLKYSSSMCSNSVSRLPASTAWDSKAWVFSLAERTLANIFCLLELLSGDRFVNFSSGCDSSFCSSCFVFNKPLNLCESLQRDVGIALESPNQDSRIYGLNCSSVVISQMRQLVVRWNACEYINYFLIWFSSSILHVVLPTLICVFAVISNLISRVDSLSIVRRSWPS
jgi:hypothetical protein